MSHAECSSAFEAEPTPAVHASPGTSLGNRARIHELELKLAEVQRDYAELYAALFEAAQVHRRLSAPRTVRYGDYEIVSEIFAVRHLPGDFFTVEEADGGLFFALGDISGKGLATGMWTTLFVGLIAMKVSTSDDPCAIVTAVNDELCMRLPAAPMASLFLARLDPVTGRVEYCSAGHPPALLLHAGGELESLSEGGPLLGVVPNASFATGRVEPLQGDVLLVYSDGIIEARNSADEEFGQARLVSELRRASTAGVDDVLFSVLGAVRDFAASEVSDDTSIVVVRRNPTER